MCSQGRYLLIDILAIFFGISAWISINGLWVELPLLVQWLPEGWHLASYLSIIIQTANIGPILYSTIRCWFGESGRYYSMYLIYGLLLLGVSASIALALTWNVTTVIRGESYSLSLFASVFILALVDCTSSVLFLPYMSMFRTIYLNSYLIGEGLSGFIPSIVTLAQGVGGNPRCTNVTSSSLTEMKAIPPDPRFSVEIFFSILATMMAVSMVSFLLLNILPGQDNTDSDNEIQTLEFRFEESEENGRQIRKLSLLLGIQTMVCFLSNGALPSIQTFSCLPYGNAVYHLSATLNAVSNPLMAFLAFFLHCKRMDVLCLITIVGTGFAGIIVATALHSPLPLWGMDLGGTITVLSWILFGGLFSYVKVSIAGICRESSALFWFGIVTQIGSALGALSAFLLVNYTSIFQAYHVICQ